ncbi:MAG: hypothetical protein EOO90_13525 [Pedobacter sp.]|nr:MAG: hypothetical protein EOO90_13525 [Pedobacter sp.]
MNNTFTLTRFGLLLKRQWLELGKFYLISFAVLFGVIVAVYGYANYLIMDAHRISTSSADFRVPLFFISGILFTTIIASGYFAHLGQKSRAIFDLMIPASTFEKFLSAVFFTVVLGIFGFLVIFYVTDLVFLTKLRDWFMSTEKAGDSSNLNNFFPYFFNQEHERLPIAVFISPLLLTAVFLLGSIYFERFHYIKTALSVLIFSGLWTFMLFKAGQILFENKIPISRSQHFVQTKDTAEALVTFAFVTLTLLFWAIAYVRLKEKEV